MKKLFYSGLLTTLSLAATGVAHADRLAMGWADSELIIEIVKGNNPMKDEQQALTLCSAKARSCRIKGSHDGGSAYCTSAVVGISCGSLYHFGGDGVTPSSSQQAASTSCSQASIGQPDFYGRDQTLESCTQAMTYCSDGFLVTGTILNPGYLPGAYTVRVNVTSGGHPAQ
jgi:hypothetical protein